MADGRYTRIKSRFWNDEKVKKWDDQTKFLALYLLTSPHNNILGCFVLPKLYICADLGWEMKQLDKPFGKLLDDGFIKYDDATSLLLIANYLTHNPIENGNQATAGVKQLRELPKSPILQDLKQLIEQFNKPFLEPLAKQIGEPVTVTVTVTATVTNNVTDSEKENKAFDSESTEYKLANYLYKKILTINPKIKEPNLQSWAKEMDLLLRVDKREPEEVKKVIDWIYKNDFWKTNILSPSKLRKQYDQVNTKRIAEGGEQTHDKFAKRFTGIPEDTPFEPYRG